MRKIFISFLLFAFAHTTQSQTLEIPDSNFFNAIKYDVDKNNDNQIQISEANAIEKLSIGEKNISSLKGIEYFTNLKELYCFKNNLNTIDISKNTKLSVLWCNSNQLTSLNVNSNTLLKEIDCNKNKLVFLDISKNTLLTNLDCSRNKLESLNLSLNKKIETLDVYCNRLTKIDLSGNKLLKKLSCAFNNFSLDLSKNLLIVDLHCDSNQYGPLHYEIKHLVLTNLTIEEMEGPHCLD